MYVAFLTKFIQFPWWQCLPRGLLGSVFFSLRFSQPCKPSAVIGPSRWILLSSVRILFPCLCALSGQPSSVGGRLCLAWSSIYHAADGWLTMGSGIGFTPSWRNVRSRWPFRRLPAVRRAVIIYSPSLQLPQIRPQFRHCALEHAQIRSMTWHQITRAAACLGSNPNIASWHPDYWSQSGFSLPLSNCMCLVSRCWSFVSKSPPETN